MPFIATVKDIFIRTGVGNFHYGDYHYTESNRKLTILGYRGESENVVIPGEINGKPIVEIGDRAFNNNYNLTNITISDSVQAIGRSAFYDYRLTSVTIGTNVTLDSWVIGHGEFTETYAANNKQGGTYTYTRIDILRGTWTKQ